MRVTLTSGNWLDLRDHKSLKAREMRPIVALASASRSAENAADASFGITDKFVSMLLSGWSYGEVPADKETAIGDLPWSDYMELVKVVQPLMAECMGGDSPSPSQSGDPDSPTGQSNA